MKRRPFIVLLTALTGCNAIGSNTSQQQAEGVTSTAVSTETPGQPSRTATATNTPTETEQPAQTPTKTETETATPTEAEKRAAQAIQDAQGSLVSLINIFTDGYGKELTSVTASSTEFLKTGYEFEVALADAQDDYTNAASVAETKDQQQLAERIKNCWQFLRLTKRTQTEVVRGYQHLVSVREAFKQVKPQSAKTAIDQLSSERQTARTQFENLTEKSTVEVAAAVPRVSEAEYNNKIDQLGSDISTYKRLDSVLREFAEGINRLRVAQAELENEEYRVMARAEENADRALDLLRDARSDIDDLTENAGEHMTLVPMLKSLSTVASNKIEEAKEVKSEY
jgi:hypothetical protein